MTNFQEEHNVIFDNFSINCGLEMMKSKRKMADPNFNFVNQLLSYEKDSRINSKK